MDRRPETGDHSAAHAQQSCSVNTAAPVSKRASASRRAVWGGCAAVESEGQRCKGKRRTSTILRAIRTRRSWLTDPFFSWNRSLGNK